MLKSIVMATLTVALVVALVHVSFAQRGGSYKEPVTMGASASELTNLVKYSGCNFDNLLDGHTGPEIVEETSAGHLALLNEYADLLARSDCIYVNRAVETWNSPPDFAVIAANMTTVTQRSAKAYLFGEFVAESVSWQEPYYYPIEFRNFDFKQMCKGAPAATEIHCIASFDRPEYQKYVTYIVKKSMNLGIQVFLFGGVGQTDSQGTASASALVKIVQELKNYAAAQGLSTLFIAQSPSIFGGHAYLDSFDLIQGGAYVDADGTLPNTAVVTNKAAGSAHAPPRPWLVRDLEGRPLYDSHKLVFEYDWFDNPADDSSEIACLSVKSQTYLDEVHAVSPANCPLDRLVGSAVPATQTIYDYFKSMGTGFLLPGRQPIAFAPWIYTPLNTELYRREPRFAINFNDEGILSLAGMKRD